MSEFKGLIINAYHRCHKRLKFSDFKGVNLIFCKLKGGEEHLDAFEHE